MSDTPVVSVLMPVHNVADHVAEAVDSVLSQTWTDFELLVIDDGSTDATAAVLAAYDDPRMRVVRQPNAGIVAALNRAIELARGPLLARMDGDDVMMPERLERQVAHLAAHPSVLACGTDYALFGAVNGVVRSPREPATCRARLVFGSVMAHPTMLVRASALAEHQIAYRPAQEYAEDFQLLSELAAHGDLANLPWVGLRYRVHARQVSSTRFDQQRILTVQICVANLAGLGIGVAPARLERVLFPTGRGPTAALRYAVTCLPHLLLLGLRAHRHHGLRAALVVGRERLRQIFFA